MSFRTRLGLFFVLIVVLPMVALAFVLVHVSDDSRTGKADARLASGMGTALTLYRDYLADSRLVSRRMAADGGLDAALASGERSRIRVELDRAAGAAGAAYASAAGLHRSDRATAGSPDAVGVVRVAVSSPRGRIGSVLVAAHSAAAYVKAVDRLTGLRAVVRR